MKKEERFQHEKTFYLGHHNGIDLLMDLFINTSSCHLLGVCYSPRMVPV